MVSPSQSLQARRRSESRMSDRCVVEQVTTGSEIDENTGEYVETVVRVYPPLDSYRTDGPCDLTLDDVAVRMVDSAGQAVIVQPATLRLPVDSSVGVREGHRVTFTASQNDSRMVGARARIAADHFQTSSTSRRFPVTLVS